MDNGYSICLNEWALDKKIRNELGLFLYIAVIDGGHKTVSVSELSNIFNISENNVYRKLKILESNKYISISKTKRNDLEVYNQLNIKNSSSGCLFCGLKEPGLLDEHHYPIRKKDGGTKIIKLCPNCHRRFHVLAGDVNPILKIKVLKGVKK